MVYNGVAVLYVSQYRDYWTATHIFELEPPNKADQMTVMMVSLENMIYQHQVVCNGIIFSWVGAERNSKKIWVQIFQNNSFKRNSLPWINYPYLRNFRQCYAYTYMYDSSAVVYNWLRLEDIWMRFSLKAEKGCHLYYFTIYRLHERNLCLWTETV